VHIAVDVVGVVDISYSHSKSYSVDSNQGIFSRQTKRMTASGFGCVIDIQEGVNGQHVHIAEISLQRRVVSETVCTNCSL
jgi:hypothetical protein